MTNVLLQHVIALLLEEAVKLSTTSGDEDQRKAFVGIWRYLEEISVKLVWPSSKLMIGSGPTSLLGDPSADASRVIVQSWTGCELLIPCSAAGSSELVLSLYSILFFKRLDSVCEPTTNVVDRR